MAGKNRCQRHASCPGTLCLREGCCASIRSSNAAHQWQVSVLPCFMGAGKCAGYSHSSSLLLCICRKHMHSVSQSCTDSTTILWRVRPAFCNACRRQHDQFLREQTVWHECTCTRQDTELLFYGCQSRNAQVNFESSRIAFAQSQAETHSVQLAPVAADSKPFNRAKNLQAWLMHDTAARLR